MPSKKCPSCGKSMEMYYIPRCFHCDKPKSKAVEVYELFPIMYYLENNYPEFNKDKFWRYLCDKDDSIRNDSMISLWMIPAPTEEPDDASDEDMQAMFDIFNKEFPDHPKARFDIGW